MAAASAGKSLPPRVIGLDIGASKIRAGLVSCDGAIQGALTIATPQTSDSVLSAARQLCRQLIHASGEQVRAIGVGSAGIINADSGKVLFANDNLPGWSGTDLTALADGDMPIAAENDARAMAYGEAVLGAGKDYRSLLCVTVGSGIGGGIITDGKLWHGAAFSAGEIGYLVVDWQDGKPLILDQFASGPAIERAWQTAAESEKRLPLTEISRMAKAGDSVAAHVIQKKARQFGCILAGIAAAVNPEAIVIGGGVPEIGALWWNAFTHGFRSDVPSLLLSTPLLHARLGVDAVLQGAAMLAWPLVRS